MLNPSASPSASISLMKYSLTWPPLHTSIAPSARVLSGSDTTSSGSTSIRVPRPVQSGQAPQGELNENDRGRASHTSSAPAGRLPGPRGQRCPAGSRRRRPWPGSSPWPAARGASPCTRSCLRVESGLAPHASRGNTAISSVVVDISMTYRVIVTDLEQEYLHERVLSQDH